MLTCEVALALDFPFALLSLTSSLTQGLKTALGGTTEELRGILERPKQEARASTQMSTMVLMTDRGV